MSPRPRPSQLTILPCKIKSRQDAGLSSVGATLRPLFMMHCRSQPRNFCHVPRIDSPERRPFRLQITVDEINPHQLHVRGLRWSLPCNYRVLRRSFLRQVMTCPRRGLGGSIHRRYLWTILSRRFPSLRLMRGPGSHFQRMIAMRWSAVGRGYLIVSKEGKNACRTSIGWSMS